jgi:hypothetical protein
MSDLYNETQLLIKTITKHMINKTFKLGLFCLFFTLIACINSHQQISQKAQAGPIANCPTDNQNKIFKKVKRDSLVKFYHCYDFPIEYLIANDLVIAKSIWLKNYQGYESSKDFLIQAVSNGANDREIHLKLAEYFYKNKNWLEAKQQIDLAELEVNHPLRLIIEYHLGDFSAGTDLNLLPYIYKSNDIKQAVVSQQGNSFNLQRVSDANTDFINGEPSMATSADGEKIWLLWTDSGQDTDDLPGFYYWTIKSIQSTDGGLTWNNFNMNTYPGKIDIFHFDPMTTYDEINQIFYAGGMVKAFDENWGSTDDDAMFLYRWKPIDNSSAGPFKTFERSPDKGWITTNSEGEIFLAHHYGVDKSIDQGETFTRMITESSIAPQPRINNDDCLIITDYNKTIRCGTTDLEILPYNFSSIFANGDNYIPGTFRVFSFAQNAIQNNNDIYVIYSDLKSPHSDETTIYMTKSTDNGQNWSSPWVITPNITGDQFIPWIEIDPNGGIHVAYYDTRNTPQLDSDTSATLDLYYSYSSDNGQTWQETRVTPTSFTTPDLHWGDYFFTDYISMSVNSDKVYLAFPWSTQPGQMHMYFAQKTISFVDDIFQDGFE